ncbi:uncharacterized protein LOC107870802 isoform X1 [Capsicum annuum]|uniref:uncharacterized protein LOC107870802 isoform X1 n=1 Tax=Capsicum annuum TaxID=4072 RepID=UPI0007BFC86B|nr:uncharacterized protein LOC107870802 isoform X1 [Capsicum annuum]
MAATPTDTSNGPSAVNGTQGAMEIDYNYPLFLHFTNVSGLQIISFQLTGIENFSIWFRSMRLSLLGRNKLGLVNGSSSKDKFPADMANHWEGVNAIVISWILSYVAKNLLGGIMYATSAQVVWNDLCERFNKIDGSRTFSNHKEIATLSQGTASASVSIYYSRLKDLWEEFEALVPIPGCNCDTSKDYVAHLQKLKLFQFLIGLNEAYSQARSQILMMNPSPSINQAYAMIVSDEGQRYAGILGSNPVSTGYESAMFSKGVGSIVYNKSGVQQGQRFKKNYNLPCEVCKIRGHTKENCWKVVGYPPDFKSKKYGHNAVCSAAVEYTSQDSSGDMQELSSGNLNQFVESKMQLGGQMVQAPQTTPCVFTNDKYNQILQLLNKEEQTKHTTYSTEMLISGKMCFYSNSQTQEINL